MNDLILNRTLNASIKNVSPGSSVYKSSEILEFHRRYKTCVESLLTFSFICWFGSLTVRDKNVLDGVVRDCSKVVGKRQASLEELYVRVRKKGKQIACDSSLMLAKKYECLPSGKRYRTF